MWTLLELLVSSDPEINSLSRQDLAAQLAGLAGLGADEDRIYTDKRTGRSMKDRPGLTQAIAALRPGDVLVVTKLDRLARSVPDARDLVGQVHEKGAALQLGPSLHDPNDPVGKFLNRPGMSGDSDCWESWSHAREHHEEVSG